jgi:hypothetical protein
MIDLLIFSKDRACQLDLLIKTIYLQTNNCFKPSILYKSTSPSFNNGYNKLINNIHKSNLDMIFIKETNFRQDVLNWVDTTNSKCVGIVTDDSIFYRHFDIQDEILYNLFNNLSATSFHTRLGLNTILQRHYSTPVWSEQITPTYYQDGYIGWNFKKHLYDMNVGRPMSLDGGIYPREIFKNILNKSHWTNPRELDAINRDQFGDMMLSFTQSVLFVNSVNLTFGGSADNWGHFHKYSLEELNDSYLANKTIRPIFNPDAVISSHLEVPLEYK